MMQKRYLEKLIALCSDEQFGQDAVEWAILSGFYTPTYNLQADLVAIMGEPGKPETGQYDALCEHWRRRSRELSEQTTEAMAPLLEEILRTAA